jgi:S-formylglutathione hydrolase
LKPDLLAAACREASMPLTLRLQPGYDHSYYFISTFMADHLAWHAERL